jgi:hypothetical protein
MWDTRIILLCRDDRLVEFNIKLSAGVVKNLRLRESQHGRSCCSGEDIRDGIDLRQRSNLVLGRVSYRPRGPDALNLAVLAYIFP